MDRNKTIDVIFNCVRNESVTQTDLKAIFAAWNYAVTNNALRTCPRYI